MHETKKAVHALRSDQLCYIVTIGCRDLIPTCIVMQTNDYYTNVFPANCIRGLVHNVMRSKIFLQTEPYQVSIELSGPSPS